MERGKITWVDKITIIRDEVSKRPKVTCEGLWSGKDRGMIGRMLLKEMRKSSNKIIQAHKQADLKEQSEEIIEEKPKEPTRIVKETVKRKTFKRRNVKNVRGQRKSE